MVIRSLIGEEVVEAALNVLPPDPSSYGRFLEKLLEGIGRPDKPSDQTSFLPAWVDSANRSVRTRQAGFVLNYLAHAPTIPSQSPAQAQGWQLPHTISRQESMPIRAALTSAHLRVYVDAWLDTGRLADGSESPRQRNLRRAPDALLALLDYLEKAPADLSASIDSSRFDPIIYIAKPTAYSGTVRDFFEAQIVEAKRLFVGIMTSDWKDRLCKCRYHRCGRYFLHPKPRQSYLHGTFCGEQAMSAAAVESHRRSRTMAPKILIDAAAQRLCALRINGPAWQDDADLKRRLASELCLVISRQGLQSYRQGVRANWLSRHRAVIERKRSELSNLTVQPD